MTPEEAQNFSEPDEDPREVFAWFDAHDAELAALSEGICPTHHTPLATTGWCQGCQAWWATSCTGQTVSRYFPPPNYGHNGVWHPWDHEPPQGRPPRPGRW